MADKSEMKNSEYKHEYDYKKQKAIKPVIEMLVEQVMEANAKKEFLQFIDYLKQQKMSVRWFVTNSYNIIFKGCKTAQLYINEGKDGQNRWQIKINTAQRDMFDDFLSGLNDDVIELFSNSFDKKKKCTGCGGCAPGKTFDFAGKHYESLCDGSNGIRIVKYVNPNPKQVEEIKKLIDVRNEFCVKMRAKGIKSAL